MTLGKVAFCLYTGTSFSDTYRLGKVVFCLYFFIRYIREVENMLHCIVNDTDADILLNIMQQMCTKIMQ